MFILSLPFRGYVYAKRLIIAVAQEAQQIEEEIDEIEIEIECTDKGNLLHRLARSVGLKEQFTLDGVDIPSGYTGEDKHTDAANNQFEHRTA